MSDDRNAGGLEDRVQRFDRLFFCRSFHSKLFPVWRSLPRQRPPGCTDRLARPRLETRDLWTRRARRHFGSLPSRPVRLAARRARFRGSNQIRSHRLPAAGTRSGFHPSVQEIKRGGCQAPAVLDRTRLSEDPIATRSLQMSRRMSRRNGVPITMISEKRAKARRQSRPARPCETFSTFPAACQALRADRPKKRTAAASAPGGGASPRSTDR